MSFNSFDWNDDVELVRGQEGWDLQNEQWVTFIEWSDEDDKDMVIVEDEDGFAYETYLEEIEWKSA